MTLHIEWDEEKAALNLKKHGVAFDEAAGVFLDSDQIDRYDAREK